MCAVDIFCLLMVYNIVDQGWNEDENGKIRREPAFASASGYGRDATGFGGGDQPCRRYIAEDRACIWRCQNERIRDHIEHCDHNGKNRRGIAYTHQKSELYGQYGFTALEQLNALSRNCCINPIPLDQFQRRLQEIAEPRGRWDLYMGSILAAGSFAVFFGGTFADGVVAALVAVLICFIQQKATKLFANTIMFNLFCSFVVGTVICLTVKVLPVLNMDKIMIGDIMLLIPGIPATNSIRDMLMGDTISGLMRLIESILWAGALACGFMAAIWMVRV